MSNYQFIADLSIPLRFDGPQPNAFGVDSAKSVALGDTRDGSSVNFEQYIFIPHCNGTHTECVGHITDERISVRECLQDVVMQAVLISVEPSIYREDRVIGIDELKEAGGIPGFDALIVRTLPNDEFKLCRSHNAENIPPYFTAEAMQYVVDCGFKHLLVDLPSIDRLYDEGKLENHRIFWNIAPKSRAVDLHTRIQSTVTEFIYVPNAVEDGEYLLNLQIAPFESDASPSRPVIFRTI